MGTVSIWKKMKQVITFVVVLCMIQNQFVNSKVNRNRVLEEKAPEVKVETIENTGDIKIEDNINQDKIVEKKDNIVVEKKEEEVVEENPVKEIKGEDKKEVTSAPAKETNEDNIKISSVPKTEKDVNIESKKEEPAIVVKEKKKETKTAIVKKVASLSGVLFGSWLVWLCGGIVLIVASFVAGILGLSYYYKSQINCMKQAPFTVPSWAPTILFPRDYSFYYEYEITMRDVKVEMEEN